MKFDNKKSMVVVAILLIAVAIVGFVVFSNSGTVKSAERDCAKVNITDDNNNGLYDINNVNELQCISGTDRDYELRSDIDASPTENWESGFEPIGTVDTEAFEYNTGGPTDSYAFYGNLTGNGYEINNIHYVGKAGLFDRIGYDGSVKNLKFNSVSGNITNYRGGVVAGTSQGDIRNIDISGSVEIRDSADTFGGVVGKLGYKTVDYQESGTIKNVNVSLDIKGGDNTGGLIGGVVGDIYTEESVVRNVKYTGNIIVNNSSTVGGVAGRNGFGSTIDRVEVDSSIVGDKQVGGVTGDMTGTISNAVVKGSVSGNTRVGGISGSTFKGRLDRVLFVGSIDGVSETGSIAGVVGYTTETVGLYQASDTVSFGAVGLDQDAPPSNSVSESDVIGNSAEDTLEEFDFDFIWRTTDRYPTIRR